MIPYQAPLHEIPAMRAARSIAVVGDGGDRRGFVDSIRALALIKRFGDRLTIIGYGRHRRTLEKWAAALRIEHYVAFGCPTTPLHDSQDGYDAVIAFERDQVTIRLSAYGSLIARFRAGDRIALANALMSSLPDGRPETGRAPDRTATIV